MQTKVNDAYKGFKDCILDGRLLPGQFVTQKELCELIGVSIAPAREAIQRLEHEMLLKVYPKRGIQISSLSPQYIRNSYQVRMIIEKEALSQFIDSAEIGEIERLYNASKALLSEAEDAVLTDELSQRLDTLDTEFHDAIVAHLDNEILSRVYQINQARIRLIRLSNRNTGDRKVTAMREHLGILSACLERDVPTAMSGLEQHLLASQRRALDGA